MNRDKQIDVMRKRNSNLSEQIKDLQFKLEYNKQLNSEGYQTAKELIEELEDIKNNWLEALNRLYDIETEYEGLISDMRNIKEVMLSTLQKN